MCCFLLWKTCACVWWVSVEMRDGRGSSIAKTVTDTSIEYDNITKPWISSNIQQVIHKSNSTMLVTICWVLNNAEWSHKKNKCQEHSKFSLHWSRKAPSCSKMLWVSSSCSSSPNVFAMDKMSWGRGTRVHYQQIYESKPELFAACEWGQSGRWRTAATQSGKKGHLAPSSCASLQTHYHVKGLAFINSPKPFWP